MTILTTFVGRVGKDAVTRFTQGGDPIVGFSLAADNGFGDKKQTLWFDASGFGKRYEAVCPYLLKGAQVWVAGEQGEREHDGKTYKTLRLTDLHSFYGESHILHGVNLTVSEGEVVTLLGRNGARRTTTRSSPRAWRPRTSRRCSPSGCAGRRAPSR